MGTSSCQADEKQPRIGSYLLNSHLPSNFCHNFHPPDVYVLSIYTFKIRIFLESQEFLGFSRNSCKIKKFLESQKILGRKVRKNFGKSEKSWKVRKFLK